MSRRALRDRAPEIVSADHPRYAVEQFTVAHAAAYLDVSPGRLYELVATKAIGHRRDSVHAIRFSQADLDTWRASRRVEAEEAPVRVRRRPAPQPSPSLVPLPMPAVRRFS